jgi:hypothetical protein
MIEMLVNEVHTATEAQHTLEEVMIHPSWMTDKLTIVKD